MEMYMNAKSQHSHLGLRIFSFIFKVGCGVRSRSDTSVFFGGPGQNAQSFAVPPAPDPERRNTVHHLTRATFSSGAETDV